MKLNCEMQIMELDGSPIAVPIGNDDFRGVLNINGVTVDILKLLENDITEDDIVLAMKKEYNAAEEQLRRGTKGK